jgi:hypothetical protein
MVGDYISTSFAGGPLAFPVFAIAKPPTDGVFDECAAAARFESRSPGRNAAADTARPVRYRHPVRPPSRLATPTRLA